MKKDKLKPGLTVLASVFDKQGIRELMAELSDYFNIKIMSTGGTADYLKLAGFKVVEVSRVTGFPEILGGRVKTLHPKIFGGILADRGNRGHVSQLRKLKIDKIDVVVVNLYPFEKRVSIEMIDIGGVSLLRAAAKNYRSVVVVCQIRDYAGLGRKLRQGMSLKERRQLAKKAFRLTGSYDRVINKYLDKAR